jgi:hypothetical protein
MSGRRFVGERCGTIIYPPFTAMGIERDGEITAGVVFNCYTGNDIAVTVAGGPFNRGSSRQLGKYVFERSAASACRSQQKSLKLSKLLIGSALKPRA